MADKGGQFTEAEKKQMKMLNEQFTLRQKYMAKIKRRNLAVFACLLASVGGICILCTKQAEIGGSRRSAIAYADPDAYCGKAEITCCFL